MKTVTWLLNLLLLSTLHYKITSGQDVCNRLNINYTNHPTPYVFMSGALAHLVCELSGPSDGLNWWRSRDPCGPFENATSAQCSRGSSTCEFDVVLNEDYLYYCCTDGMSPPGSADSSRQSCLQVSICPMTSAATATIPPSAFFGENLVFYLALDVSPEIELNSKVSISNHFSNSIRGRPVPSNLPRQRLLYEFVVPLPRLNMSGVLSNLQILGRTPCNTDFSVVKMVYITDRDSDSQPPPSSTTSLTVASSSHPLPTMNKTTTADAGTSAIREDSSKWRLGAIFLICVVIVLLLLLLGMTIISCYKISSLNKANRNVALCNGNHPVQYNPLSAVSREDTTPSDQANLTDHPLAVQCHTSHHPDQAEPSPPAYKDLTPVKSSLPNLLPLTPSPTTTENRTVMSRTSNHHTQLSQQELAGTPTGNGSSRPPPTNLDIGGFQQQSHTGETPLMGLDTPSNPNSTKHPFVQQFHGSIEVTEHVYAQPELPLSAKPPAPSMSHSEVGSNTSSSSTVLSRASRPSVALEENNSLRNGSAAADVSRRAGHELYSMQRINQDANDVSLVNSRAYESENVNI